MQASAFVGSSCSVSKSPRQVRAMRLRDPHMAGPPCPPADSST